MHPVDAQQDRSDREDEEAEIVHAHSAEHVADAAEAHDEDARHDEVPSIIQSRKKLFPGPKRVEIDSPEDGRHRDEDDRLSRSWR